MNIAEVLLKLQDIADAPFDSEVFALQLIEAYSPPKSTLAKLRQGSLNKADKKTDLLWPKRLHVRLAESGEAAQVLDTLAAEWANKKNIPRLLVAVDGAEIVALDTKLDDPLNIKIQSLSERYDFFLPLGGVERYQGVPDSPADIRATGRLAKFYDAILEANPDWTAHRRVHELNLFLTRILFCMFAQSTRIFPPGLFSQTLNECTSIEGGDTSEILQLIFEALDLDTKDRSNSPEYAKRFPYVNGGLFRDRTAVPRFSRIARRILIDAARLNWAEINPDIFGSMIQAVVKPDMRDELGMHYTSVPNIMKVLRPLFLDAIEQELSAAGDSIKKLEAVLTRIRRVRVFDPACGSGNFLIIAYKELCKLEMKTFEALKRQNRLNQQFKLPYSEVRLEHFLGVDLEDFAVETAKLSLYIAQHQMNVLFRDTFGFGPPDLPLRDSGRVSACNALDSDWAKLCPPSSTYDTYIVGNPPYLGSVNQSADQKEDMKRVFSNVLKTYKDLDFVAAWFVCAARYMEKYEAKSAFVATSSISQGEQVAMLWPIITALGIEIYFCCPAFKWKNSASNNAGVSCVIVGLRRISDEKKAIYRDETVQIVKNINAYLIASDDVIVRKRTFPISDLGKMDYGNKPTDGGNLIMSPEEKDALLEEHPEANRFVRRYMGSNEFLYSLERFCLWIDDGGLPDALKIPQIKRRIDAVKAERLKSKGQQANSNASRPHQFVHRPHRDLEAIVVPSVSSEDRPYLPVGFVGPDTVINNLAFAIYDAKPHFFALLSSRLHLVWTATIGGRHESRLRYSNTLVWNTFPLPDLSQAQINLLEERAWEILSVRERYAGKTIADLYNADTIPTDLTAAHIELDNIVEGIYNGKSFNGDAERLEHLFKRYKLMTAKVETPLLSNKRLPRVKAKSHA